MAKCSVCEDKKEVITYAGKDYCEDCLRKLFKIAKEKHGLEDCFEEFA